MRFNNDELKSRYWTLRNYLEERCSVLEGTIENKFNCECIHTNSSSYGFSNYFDVEREDGESITIRVSDHPDTGASLVDEFVWINNAEWRDIKKEILSIVEKFVNECE